MRKALGFFVLLVSIWGFFGQPGVLARVDGLRETAAGILRSPQSVLVVFSLSEKGSGEATAPLTNVQDSKDGAKQPEKPSMRPKAGETKKSGGGKSSEKATEAEKPGADEKEPKDNIHVGTKTLKEWERAAFDAVNAERKRLGLEPFEWDEEAAKICRLRAKEMFQCRIFAHYSPISAKAFTPYFERDLLEDIAPAYECIAGVYAKYKDELLSAAGIGTVTQVWYESPKHRKVMTDALLKKAAVGLAVVDEPINVRYLKLPTWADKTEPTVAIMCFIARP